jgi:hypothetical protein
MPENSPNLTPLERQELVPESGQSGDLDPWVEDGDPLPEGWEDWTEDDMSVGEDVDDLDWSELEGERPPRAVGYRVQVCLPDLDGLKIDALCDTGRSVSRLHASREILRSDGVPIPSVELEGEPAVELDVHLADRNARVVIRLEETEEAPYLILGRDVLRLGWTVDVRLGSEDKQE